MKKVLLFLFAVGITADVTAAAGKAVAAPATNGGFDEQTATAAALQYGAVPSGKSGAAPAKTAPAKKLIAPAPAPKSGNAVPESVTASLKPGAAGVTGVPASPTGSQDLNMAVMQINQKAMMNLQQLDQNELAQAVQEAFNEALVSKDFEKGVDQLADALQTLFNSLSRRVEVCNDTHAKLTKVLKDMNSDFEQLIKSGKVGSLPGDLYIVRLIRGALSGIDSGISRAKKSNKNCTSATAAPGLQMPSKAASSAPAQPVKAPMRAAIQKAAQK